MYLSQRLKLILEVLTIIESSYKLQLSSKTMK